MFGHDSSSSVGKLLRGTVAGMIGGAVGAWVMNNFNEHDKVELPAASDREAAAAPHRQHKAAHNGGHSSTVQVAEAVSRKVFDHELNTQEKQMAAPAVHFGYATLVGGLYGGLAELWPNVKVGMGMGYGIALWAFGHEAALPALKLAPSPLQQPAREHADQLSSHICFGMTLDFVRRIAKLFI